MLEPPEYSALLVMASGALRDPRDQIRFVLREALERSGLLPRESISADQCAQAQFLDEFSDAN